MRKAIVKSGIVTNVIEGSIKGSIPCDDIVGIGWLYDGTTFTPPIKTLVEAKDVKTSEINSAFESSLSVIISQYPLAERESWFVQSSEAKAYLIDNTVATPFLSALLIARSVAGETLADLALKIKTNADAYEAMAASSIGQRTTLVAAVSVATTVTEVDAVVWA